ncbi:TetR/AcrR family transcriptional regulator [Nocardioides sp. Bht2]|uniref:TetR/AcrR family transcriptional regulator n=1 Tax=Nocardioides sp. Bht2 TaxID=3392297 RepID=UPI0039B47367
MTSTVPSPAPAPRAQTRQHMLEVAERLFAEHGLEGVSLRSVGQAAGQRNNSAAQYHFGTRDGLVGAIVAERSTPVEERRGALLDAMQRTPSADPLADLVRCFVAPLAELAAAASPENPSWYLRFLAQLVALRGGHAAAELATRPTQIRRLEGALRTELPELDDATFARRMRWLAQTATRTLADQEREATEGTLDVATEQLVSELVTMLTALLRAA